MAPAFCRTVYLRGGRPACVRSAVDLRAERVIEQEEAAPGESISGQPGKRTVYFLPDHGSRPRRRLAGLPHRAHLADLRPIHLAPGLSCKARRPLPAR